MITAIALALATFAADTTVPATKSQRLDVDLHEGSVTVRAWNRDAVKVEGAAGRRGELEVRTTATTVSVDISGRHGPASADLVITVPVGMAIDVNGVELDVTVENCRCAAHIESVQGDVIASGTNGTTELQSVEGDVRLNGATGNVQASSVNSDVEVRDVTGDVSAETVNGDVTLARVGGGSVSASTVNGDVDFDGEIRPGGTYGFSSHQGDVTVVVPGGVRATVRVNTFNGSFESDFNLTLSGRAGRSQRMTFDLGGGGASISLESFSGDIRLLKTGSSAAKGPGSDHDDQ